MEPIGWFTAVQRSMCYMPSKRGGLYGISKSYLHKTSFGEVFFCEEVIMEVERE